MINFIVLFSLFYVIYRFAKPFTAHLILQCAKSRFWALYFDNRKILRTFVMRFSMSYAHSFFIKTV